MEAVTRKLDFVLHAQTPDYRSTFAPQVKALRMLAQTDRAGLIERVAYTWFNRLAALRFMDAKGWHPFRARVLTPASATETQPELLKLTRTGALPEELRRHTDPVRLNDLLDGRIPSPDAQGEVYRHLVLAACRFYNALLPSLFEKLDDETELLLPDDLLTEHSVVHGFRTEISDEDCAEVELLGWLYQFYISERKDQVMARKSAVSTEDIPSVTQLFTPHWIVRYLVENSLGRLWLLNRPGSKLREHMPYYIAESAEAPGEGGRVPEDFLKITKPEELKLLDPASGSGHMLTYAFDLLCRIYEEEGYAPSDIPALILRHNLYGLEICARAAQLSQLALVFKAREKSRRFLQPEQMVPPNIIELREVSFEKDELADYFKAIGGDPLPPRRDPASLIPDASSFEKLLHQFEEAKNFGSLIQPCLTEQEIQRARLEIVNRQSKIANVDLMITSTHYKVLRVLEQAEALTQRYHVVVANPPYMGSGAMHQEFKSFVEVHFPDSKADLSVIFIERISSLALKGGLIAMVTMHNWMFLSSYRDMRRHLLQSSTLTTMAHFGIGAFTTLNSKVVQTTAFCLVNGVSSRVHKPDFFRLVAGNEEAKDAALRSMAHRFSLLSQGDFEDIPASPIAYWATRKVVEAFSKGTPVGEYFFSDGLTKTGNNAKYLRKWWEVSRCLAADPERYRICVKGGDVRKYFGNTDTLVVWNIQARQHYRQDNVARITPEYLWQAQGLSWTKVTSARSTFRWFGEGMIAETGGPAIFAKDGAAEHMYLGLACLSSRVAEHLIEMVNPTLNIQTADILGLPLAKNVSSAVIGATKKCVSIARADWDNFETSWDFRDLPLLRPDIKLQSLEKSWDALSKVWNTNIARMQELETENNRLFIAAYGLQDELKPEVPGDQITLARPDVRKDMAAFLSYAVGCMMGRYSLDKPGLILANAGESLREYLEKVGLPQEKLTFTPDEDGIIPVLDGEWFEDDIFARTREFLRATFGEATLRENIRFIEESLGRELRTYFLADFYKDHLQTYKKRPIYWMVQSPRKGFQCLIYLHRYTKDTVNLVLNRYLRDYQAKLRNRLAHLTGAQATAATAREKTEARKETDKLTKILHECAEWERQTVLPLAQQRIELDLDDGVKTNYLKLGEALAPIAGLAAKEEE